MSTKHQLNRAAKDNRLVRIHREELEEGWADGFVVGTGPDFFVLELVDKSIRYDGFNCMRYADVSRCDIPSPHSEFVEKALELRGLRRRESLQVDLSTISSMLRTANTAFPVVTIHLEIQDPDTCYIGKVCAISGSEVELRPVITPDAEWQDESEEYALDEITRVDFGGAYEEALVLVANAGGRQAP